LWRSLFKLLIKHIILDQNVAIPLKIDGLRIAIIDDQNFLNHYPIATNRFQASRYRSINFGGTRQRLTKIHLLSDYVEETKRQDKNRKKQKDVTFARWYRTVES